MEHVFGRDNPADCASRGMPPSQLVDHDLWWTGPDWLHLDAAYWPKPPQTGLGYAKETDELCIPSYVTVTQVEPAIPFDRFSSFSKLIRVTAWIHRFIFNCRTHCKETSHPSHCLSISELKYAEQYWISFIQNEIFHQEIN